MAIAAEFLLAAAAPEQVPELIEGHLDLPELGRIVIQRPLQLLLLGDELGDSLDQVAVVHSVSDPCRLLCWRTRRGPTYARCGCGGNIEARGTAPTANR